MEKNAKHSVNISLSTKTYQAYTLAGRCIPPGVNRLEQWNMRRTYCIAPQTRPAFIDLLSSHVLVCRKDEWGVEKYSDCLVLCSGLTRFMFRPQRSPVGVRDLLCRWHTELMFYDANVLAVLSLTFWLNVLNLS